MFIKAIYTKGTQRRYFICEKNGVNETDIAWFDDLEKAALVMRYMKGSTMRPQDQEEAILLLRRFDIARSGEPRRETDTPPGECAKT